MEIYMYPRPLQKFRFMQYIKAFPKHLLHSLANTKVSTTTKNSLSTNLAQTMPDQF